jgi:predicted HTH domain antitoxin
MTLSMEVPDQIARSLRLDGPQPDRRALEMLAIEGYRAGDLSCGQIGALLGLSFYETEEFLKKNHAYIQLTLEEFQDGSDALETLLSK